MNAKSIIVSVVALMLSASTGHAANYVWYPATSPDTTWGNAANWSPGMPPEGSDVEFNGNWIGFGPTTVTLDATHTVHNILFDYWNNGWTFNGPGTLNVTGNFTYQNQNLNISRA